MKTKMFLSAAVGIVCTCGFAEEVQCPIMGANMTTRTVRVTSETLEKQESAEDFEIKNGVLVKWRESDPKASERGSLTRRKRPTSVTIPSGVTSIGRSAFGWCRNLTSVTIPTSVTNIDNSAFSGCMRLKSVAIPPDTTNIGERAFEHCEGLTSLLIPSGVKCVRPYTFHSCTGLTSLTIRPGVKEIGHCAFWYCDGLDSVTLPPGVESIGSWAFADCRGLKTVTIPSSTTNIGERAFGCCSAIRTFVVDEANAHYSSKNGLLCSKDGSVLIAGVNGVVSIPSSVTRIDQWAFDGRGGLVSFAVDPGNSNYSSRSGLLCTKDGGELVVGINGDVTIPSCVTNVMEMAFFFREGLKSVAIPSSVVKVGELSFAGCGELMSFTVDDANAYYSDRNGLLCSKDGSALVAGINGEVTVPSCVARASFQRNAGLFAIAREGCLSGLQRGS